MRNRPDSSALRSGDGAMVISPQQTSLPDKRKKAYKIGITLAALAFLFWMLDYIGWSVIAEHIALLGLQGVLVLLFLGFAESTLDAAALKAATRQRIGLLKILSFNQAGSLVNIIIPWEAGEVLKGRLLSHHMSPKTAIATTVIWNYIFKLSKPAAALTAAGIGWLFALPAQKTPALMIAGASVAAFAPYGIMRLALRLGPAGLIVRLAAKLRILGQKDPQAMLKPALEIDQTVRNFWRDSPLGYLKVFAFQYLARITAWFTYFVALRYLDATGTFSLTFCGMIYAGLSVATYLVLILPTRIGTTEGAGYVVFHFLALNPPLGLILQLIMRLKAIACAALPAAAALFDKKTASPQHLECGVGDNKEI